MIGTIGLGRARILMTTTHQLGPRISTFKGNNLMYLSSELLLPSIGFFLAGLTRAYIVSLFTGNAGKTG
jgi:hypothetical protein